ncbi:MAG TPA: 4-hydroxy-tetrahydrodipicolinate reductase [Acidimicrobiales bacterium]|nr:4-hydroxy-tetrahydrodipicolinate reductase [Acidimicrobiales bacterium]
MSTLKVGVVGAAGRMGQQTCAAVDEADDLELVARIDRTGSPADAAAADAEVVIDFTVPDAAMTTIEAALGLGMHVVVGTSGFDADRLAKVEALVEKAPGLGVVIAPNFAIGAVLLMKFAREAAAHFTSVEIVETHHPDKVDAPSGTAVHTARVIAEARRTAGIPAAPDATSHALDGARGASVDGVPVHSLRLRGAVAHEEVIFGSTGELLTLRHDSLDRAGFMPGVLLAVRHVVRRPGLTVGLEPLLDLVRRH